MKEAIGVVAVFLTFVGYVPYIRDTIKGKTRPHIYTWFIWTLVTAIAFALQLSDKAGPGAYVTLAAAVVCFAIFIIGTRQGDKRYHQTGYDFPSMFFYSSRIVAICRRTNFIDNLAFVY